MKNFFSSVVGFVFTISMNSLLLFFFFLAILACTLEEYIKFTPIYEYMKEFVLLALKASTSEFNLNDIAKYEIDIVSEFILNTLWISNDLRRDTIVHVSMNGSKDPPKLLTLYADKLKGLQPNQQHIAKIINQAVKYKLKKDESKEIIPGFFVSKTPFEVLIKKKDNLLYLNKKGTHIREADIGENPMFVIGDYIGLPKKAERLLSNLKAKKLSLGKTMLFAAHCPIIIHYELDL